MVVAWDTINFHSLLNQVQLTENKYQNLENNCLFGTLFWHGDCWSKTFRWNRKLVTGPYSGALQTWVISYPFRTAVVPHYMERFIKRCWRRVVTQFWNLASREVTLLILERERERGERERERASEREREIWSILTPSRVHALSTPNDFWTICGKATWTRAVLKQNFSIKSTKINKLVSIWVSFKPELSILESCGPRCVAV